jgi:hypothetical protein
MTGRGEWLIDTHDRTAFDGKTEAEFLSKSITDVSAHYKVEWLDQKSIDIANLVQCLLIVYGGRFYAIRSTPKVKPAPAPAARPVGPLSTQAPPQRGTVPPTNDYKFADTENPASATIPGLGMVTLPDDHPLNPARKLN